MSSPAFDVPVVLLAWNRPRPTARVFAAVRAARPRRLLVSVDGPRRDVPGDAAAVARVRRIATAVDWPCEVSVRFADDNLGCRFGPVAGLDWAFGQVDRAVVLEDDCLPAPAFFPFCAHLLDRYAGDPTVMTIAGHRWEAPDQPDGDSYWFSRYPATWGWATWADRWRHFDLAMRQWPELRETGWLPRLVADPVAAAFWRRTFDAMVAGMDAWDYAWLFASWRHGGLTARPAVNLVRNLGFGPDSTHTRDPAHPAARPAGELPWPLRHPVQVRPDDAGDARVEWVVHSGIEIRRLRAAAGEIAARRASKEGSP